MTDEVPIHDLLMVLGDLNARPGNNKIGRDRVMGKHGIGTVPSMTMEKGCVTSVIKTTWS